jgi:hypothetical protein
MNSTMRSVVASAGVCVGLMFAQAPASAGPGDVTKSGAAFWEWAFSIPADVNPLLDEDGTDCMVGQSGGVWYLAGNWNGSPPAPVARNCTVPAGTAFFVPVFNFVNVNTPDLCGQPGSFSSGELRAQVAPFVDGATNLTLTVDGAKVANLHRSKSGVFSVTMPEDNLFNVPTFCGPGGIPAGVYSPAIDDGYYGEVGALGAGSHVIHAHADWQFGTVDVTYHITAVPTVNH